MQLQGHIYWNVIIPTAMSHEWWHTYISFKILTKVTYMPYGGVMWVTLPVACKRKESSSDTVNVAEATTSSICLLYTYVHTHTHTGVRVYYRAVYTAHTSLSPPIHSSAKFGGSSEGICLQWRGLGLLNNKAWARIRNVSPQQQDLTSM